MAKNTTKINALTTLLNAAPAEVLRNLISILVTDRPDIRRECFEFLKEHQLLSGVLKKRADSEIVLSLWDELEPDLNELDTYGGGDYDLEDYVGGLLSEICELLNSNSIDSESRMELLNRILPFIESGNAGMDDMLHEVAHAACYNDSDLMRLAQAFEGMRNQWKINHAREIYRTLGDRDKYLELRTKKLVYGHDYYDLATFYWESGEREKAIQIAEEGLRKGTGRMDELRGFVAQRAKASGDRKKYIRMQFEQTTDNISFEKYKAFKKLCTPEEWSEFEPKILASLKTAWRVEALKIRMHREEFDKALEILIGGGYPINNFAEDYILDIAEKLEKLYPEEILKYYLSGIGNIQTNAQRKEYARKADVMAKIQRVIVDVLHDHDRWKTFAKKIKFQNIRRPAFQEEFASRLPGWKNI